MYCLKYLQWMNYFLTITIVYFVVSDFSHSLTLLHEKDSRLQFLLSLHLIVRLPPSLGTASLFLKAPSPLAASRSPHSFRLSSSWSCLTQWKLRQLPQQKGPARRISSVHPSYLKRSPASLFSIHFSRTAYVNIIRESMSEGSSCHFSFSLSCLAVNPLLRIWFTWPP